MAKTSYATALDLTLRPLGFSRTGDDWIRIRGDLWDRVNRQQSRWGLGVTVNLEQKDLATERLFLEIFEPEGAIQMPPTSTRLGTLIDGYDQWWKGDDAAGPANMAKAVVEYGLPWFDRIRTLDDQFEHWYSRGRIVTSSGYFGPSLIGLALTLHRIGKTDEACDVLRKPVPKTAIKSSVENVARVREWLGCPSPGGASTNLGLGSVRPSAGG